MPKKIVETLISRGRGRGGAGGREDTGGGGGRGGGCGGDNGYMWLLFIAVHVSNDLSDDDHSITIITTAVLLFPANRKYLMKQVHSANEDTLCLEMRQISFKRDRFGS